MAIIKASTKGQIVIPAELRQKFGIEPGTYIAVEEVPEGLLLRPLGQDLLSGMRGILKGSGSLTKELLDERARDLAREEAKYEYWARKK